MSTYTAITIIYNPNSTGSSEETAKRFAADIEKELPKQQIVLRATEYAGHAEELAYEAALGSKQPLIISASGDGGYHEVVNGALQAQQEGASPTTGLIPTGNANDHHRNLHNGDFIKNIATGTSQIIDVLKCTTKVNEKPYERYAHSYIGFGLTPKAGRELNKTSLNFITEKWAVVKTLIGLKPTRLIVNGKLRSYDSLVFSNIADMSKVLSLSEVSKPDDGKFEITAIHNNGFISLLRELFKAVTSGLQSENQVSAFTFKTKRRTLVQLDGEIASIDAGADVHIESTARALRCIV